MSWPKGLVAWLTVACLAPGCGFEPLYSKGAAVSEARGQIRIEQIADRAGQQLRNHLLLKMNPGGEPRHPAHVLRINLVETKRELSVRQDDVATRANLKIDAKYVLRRTVDGQPVFSGGISSTNSYNILESEFGSLKAEANARARALRDLSDALTTRLAVYLRSTR